MVNIYLPLDSFIGNIDNFEFPIQRFIGWQLLFCVVIACFAATLLFLIPDKVYTYVYAALLGIGIAAYVQYNFLNSELTLLGVSNDALSVSTKTKVINIIVWLVIIAACVALAVVLKKFQKKDDKNAPHKGQDHPDPVRIDDRAGKGYIEHDSFQKDQHQGLAEKKLPQGAAGQILRTAVYTLVFVVSVSYLAMGSHNPFIYFNF